MQHASCRATANTLPAPPSVQYFHCDLADKSSIIQASSAVRASLGHPTVLINNAGCARGKTILDSTENDIRLTFNVNTLSHYFLAQQFLPHMIEKNHGMVVTVASLAAVHGPPHPGAPVPAHSVGQGSATGQGTPVQSGGVSAPR